MAGVGRLLLRFLIWQELDAYSSADGYISRAEIARLAGTVTGKAVELSNVAYSHSLLGR